VFYAKVGPGALKKAILSGRWGIWITEPFFVFVGFGLKIIQIQKKIIAIDGFDDYYKEFSYKD